MKKLLGLFLLMTWGLAYSQNPVFNQFSPGGDLAGTGSTWNNQVIANGAVTLAKQANLLADSIQCNTSSSAGAPTACNPLAIANLMSASVSVWAAVASLSASTPAYGVYTIDGFTGITANEVVLVVAVGAGQTCGAGTASDGTGGAISGDACGGLWLVKAGAPWVRPVNFPSGYVIAQFCNFLVQVAFGNTYQGHSFVAVATLARAVTIDTTAPSFVDKTLGPATSTALGTVTVTGSTQPVASVTGKPASVGGAIGDCTAFSATAGSVADLGDYPIGNLGPCIVGDPNGHINAYNAGQSTPAVTGTGCSLASGGQDNSGAIIATGPDTCALTFGTTFNAGAAPFCAVAGYSASVLPYVSTAATTSKVVFTTAAAGTFSYVCL